jgi:hypothetical protein
MKNAIVGFLVVSSAFAGEPWTKPAAQWNEQDAARILHASPWARQDRRTKVNIRWETAEPVQLAAGILHLNARIGNDPSLVAIAVVSSPELAATAGAQARLKATGRDSVQSVDSKTEGQAVYYFFRRSDLRAPVFVRLPIGIPVGNDIEFETHIGSQQVKAVFSPAKMIYLGKLEL